MPLGINAQDGLTVFQKECGGMPQILSGLTVDQHLTIGGLVQIHQWQPGNGGRLLG